MRWNKVDWFFLAGVVLSALFIGQDCLRAQMGCDNKCRERQVFFESQTAGLYCRYFEYSDCRLCKGQSCSIGLADLNVNGACNNTNQMQDQRSKAMTSCTVLCPVNPPYSYSEANFGTVTGEWRGEGKKEVCQP